MIRRMTTKANTTIASFAEKAMVPAFHPAEDPSAPSESAPIWETTGVARELAGDTEATGRFEPARATRTPPFETSAIGAWDAETVVGKVVTVRWVRVSRAPSV